MNTGEILIYQNKEGSIKIDVRLEDETVQLMVISEKGYGKRTSYDEFSTKGRGGKGMTFLKVTELFKLLLSLPNEFRFLKIYLEKPEARLPSIQEIYLKRESQLKNWYVGISDTPLSTGLFPARLRKNL